MSIKKVRAAVKAIIIHNGKLLCTKNKDAEGYYYRLPGGGQEHGENIHDALRRECFEEISVNLHIGDVVFVRDYIGKNHEFASTDSHFHQVEYMFDCKLKDGEQPKKGTTPDNKQVGVEWVDLSRFDDYRVYPEALKKHIFEDGTFSEPIYIGDVN